MKKKMKTRRAMPKENIKTSIPEKIQKNNCEMGIAPIVFKLEAKMDEQEAINGLKMEDTQGT